MLQMPRKILLPRREPTRTKATSTMRNGKKERGGREKKEGRKGKWRMRVKRRGRRGKGAWPTT